MQNPVRKTTYPMAAISLVCLTTLCGCDSDNNMRDLDDRDYNNSTNWDSGSAPHSRNTVGGSPQGTGNGMNSGRGTSGSVNDYPPSTENTIGGTPQGTGTSGGTSGQRRDMDGSSTRDYPPDQNNTVGGTPQGTGTTGTTGNSPRTGSNPRSPNTAGNSGGNAGGNTGGVAQDRPVAQNVSADDRRFVNDAAVCSLFEVRSSQIALQQNPDADLKHIADMMIKDHTAANNELMAIARRKNITLPTELDAKHAEMIAELDKIDSNAAFGSTYREQQVKAHEEAVALFAEAAENASDADIRAFAAKTLPTLRTHLEHMRNMN